MKTDRVALHRYYNEGEVAFAVSDGQETKVLDESSWAKFVKKLKPASLVISTSANGSDAILALLRQKNIKVRSAHWHSTGIAKNLQPEEIVQKFAELPDDVLREVYVRSEIIELRAAVNARDALQSYRKKANNVVTSINWNAAGSEKPAFVIDLEKALKSGDEDNPGYQESETELDKHVKVLAKRVPECQVLHELMGTKDAWISAASIIARIQDVRRFPQVSSLWHYAGLHGPNVKRQKGKAQDWNTKLKTALYLWASACMKGGDRIPTFRQPFEQYRAEERAIHEQKCKCKTPDGHSTARALRRVEKNLLRDFWVAMNRYWDDKSVRV